jgi:hypothetical protein
MRLLLLLLQVLAYRYLWWRRKPDSAGRQFNIFCAGQLDAVLLCC